MKLVEWDIVEYFNGKAMNEIKTQEVSVIVDKDKRYIITIYDGSIAIYKTGYENDQITVLPVSNNRILIK